MRVKVLIHKMSAFLLSFMMLLTNVAPTIVYAMEDKARYSKDEYYEYELTREGYKISGLTQEGRDKLYLDDKELIIPSHHKDIPVIGIAKNALSNEKIKTLVLPDSVKEIDDYALYQDKKGEGVEEIRGYSEDSNIILERVGDSSFANNELKEIPISKELGKNTYLNNKIEYADLTYTEKIGDYAFKGNKNLETIVNKYSEVGKKVFEEDAKIEYVEKEFNKKETDNTDIDYLAIRQRALNSENNKKEEEKTEENNDDSEESHHDEKKPEESYDNKEEQGKIKVSQDYKVIEEKRTLDEILEDAVPSVTSKITSFKFNIKTGTEPFDATTDAKGHDSDDTNNVIRTNDDLKIDTTFSFEQSDPANPNLNNGKIHIELYGPNVDWFNFDLDNANAVWANGTATQTVVGDKKVLSGEFILPDKQSAVMSFTSLAHISTAHTDEVFDISGKAFLVDDIEAETYTFQSEQLRTTAEIRAFFTNNFHTRQRKDEIIDSRSGIKFSTSTDFKQQNPGSLMDTRGINYNIKDLSYKVNAQLFYIANNGAGARTEITDVTMPKINDYAVQGEMKSRLGKFPTPGSIISYSDGMYNYWGTGYLGNASMYNPEGINPQIDHQGTTDFTVNSPNNVSVTTTGFDLNDEHQNFFYPTESDQTPKSYPALVRKYEYGILSHMYNWFIPYPTTEELAKKGLPDTNYRLEFVLNYTDITYKDDKGQTYTLPNQKRNYLYDVYSTGNLTRYHYFLDLNNRVLNNGSAADYYNSAYPGESIRLQFHSAVSNRNITDYSQTVLLRFDADGFEINDGDIHGGAVIIPYRNPSQSIKSGGLIPAFGVKKDGTNWSSQDEMNKDSTWMEDNLNFYSTKTEALKHGKIVALGLTYPKAVRFVRELQYNTTRVSMIVNPKATLKDSYSFVGDFIFYKEPIKVNPFLDPNMKVYDNYSIKFTGNDTGTGGYNKTVMLPDGSLDPNTNIGGFQWGRTLFIYQAFVENAIHLENPTYRPTANTMNLSNENDAYFRIDSSLIIPQGNLSVDSSVKDVYYTITLPKYIKPASSSVIIGGAYNQDTNDVDGGVGLAFESVTENADGTTTIIIKRPLAGTPEAYNVAMYLPTKVDLSTPNLETMAIESVIYNPSYGTSAPKNRTSNTNLNVVNLQAYAIDKALDPWVVEHISTGDTNVKFNISGNVYNNTKTQSNDILVVDYLPYNGIQGSKYNGSYSINNVVTPNGEKVYYTTDKNVYNYTALDAKNNLTWQEYSGGALTGAKAFYFYTDIPANTTAHYSYDLMPDSNSKSADIYKTYMSTHIPSTNTILNSKIFEGGIVERSISGLIWHDANMDGIRQDTEEIINNAKVELLKNGIIEKNITTTNGKYQFDYLLKGNYQVRFTPTDSKYKGYAVTKKAIGTTDRNSDINTGYITDNIELIDAQLLAEGAYSQRVVNIDAGIYSNKISITKNVTKKFESIEDKDYEVKVFIKDKDNNNIDDTFTYKSNKGLSNSLSNTVKNEDVIKIKDGETITIENLPEGAKVSIEEIVPEGFTLIKDASITEGVVNKDTTTALNLENEYTPTGSFRFKGNKRLLGRDIKDYKFTFTVIRDGKLIQKVNNDEQGNILFEDIALTKEDIGETYKYQIVEYDDKQRNIIYDQRVYEIKVTIKDDGKGNIIAEFTDPDITFSNAHKEMPVTGFNYNFYIPVLILIVVTLILFNDKRRIFKEI